MGLMFARRRMEENAKRAAHKAKAQGERHAEVKSRHAKADEAKQPKDKADGTDSKGTK